MKYSEEDIKLRLSYGEDSQWEFKQLVFSGNSLKKALLDKLANEIAAFANASGGNLLCGVEDTGEVQGLTRAQMDNSTRAIQELSQNSIKPSINLSIFRIPVNDKLLLHVFVEEGYAKHTSPGGCYIRSGASARRMNSDEALRLAQQRGQFRFHGFDKRHMPQFGLATLDEEKWKPLLSVEGKKDPEAALVKMGVLSKDGMGEKNATVAGILLFSRRPEEIFPNAVISAAYYRGADRSSQQIAARIIDGSLDQQIRHAQAFASGHMSVAARKEPSRIDMPQYSERAVFEALVNAVVHRDYSVSGSRIRLSMYSDRLEISSPGSLPNNLTVDAIGERQSTRNETIASLLGRIPVGDIPNVGDREFFIERRGDGVPIIMRETLQLCGKLPTYRMLDEAELLLTIPAAQSDLSRASIPILVYADGKPLPGANVLALFPNNTWKQAKANEEGIAHVELYTTTLPMTVFAASEGYSAGLEEQWVPADRNLALNLRSLPEGGSVIYADGTGHVPLLRGRINPIRDTFDRTYVYASNIAIYGGKQQPVAFEFGEDLIMHDADGNKAIVRIVRVLGRSSLVEYQRS